MPKIGELIVGDASEVVRDKLAELLAAEVAGQKALAVAGGADPELWDLRIFSERSRAWEVWLDGEVSDERPIVNVATSRANFLNGRSNPVSRQSATMTYWVDCFGVGVTQADATSQLPADRTAALAAQRAVRIVRNILMAATYTYLDLQGTVVRRWISGIEYADVTSEPTTAVRVAVGRISLDVDLGEVSPQVTGEPLHIVATTITRDDGELLVELETDFGG